MKIKISISADTNDNGGYTGDSGLYSSVKLTPLSTQNLTGLCDLIDVDLPESAHCTVMYSREKTLPKRRVFDRNLGREFKAKATRVNWWEGHDKAGYLVLECDSPDLQEEHQNLLAGGCEHSFPDYLPHVTLCSPFKFNSEEHQKSVLRLANLSLRRNPLSLVFHKQKIDNIKNEN